MTDRIVTTNSMDGPGRTIRKQNIGRPNGKPWTNTRYKTGGTNGTYWRDTNKRKYRSSWTTTTLQVELIEYVKK